MLAWLLYLPAYGLIAVTASLPLLVVAAVGTGAGETISYVLLNSAAQEEVPDAVLGRVLGLISFVHRGAHATGLLLVAPPFAVAATQPLFRGGRMRNRCDRTRGRRPDGAGRTRAAGRAQFNLTRHTAGPPPPSPLPSRLSGKS